jgi:hypothetical protein
LAINGENTVLIAQVLNHTSLQHTHIYARLNTAPVSRALSHHEDQVFEGKHTTRRDVPPPPGFEPPRQRGTSVSQEIQSSKDAMEWPG